VTPAIPDPARRELVLSGQYPRGCGEQALSLNLFEPAATFEFIFRGLWAESGGTLAGQTLPGIAPVSPPLLRVESPPLTDALTSLNKYSNNLMARNLFLSLGAARFGPPATLDKGRRAVQATLDEHAIATDKLVLENGAGLSRIERISARSLSQLLQAAYASPLFSEFESALPIVAIDGTLKRRFNGSPLVGNAHLKTGSLRDVSALAGYVYSARGRRIAFVMLVNHERAGRAQEAQRRLLEWVWHDQPAVATPSP
jgi:D-alanyl-D-alanine carboxypeptidase/D-alanyl-D-alanine-endopeptidase (penicillin-binding protein 4)